MKKLSLIILSLLLNFISVLAQPPEIGKPCPEFLLSKIDFWKSDKLALSDLRGKWLVLDFWSIGCSSCVASLPEISRNQIELGNLVQFVMVGPDDRKPDHNADRKMYASYHKKLKLTMPSAFDSKLANRFGVGLLPHTIIVDPAGIVRAITTTPDRHKLRDLIAGKKVLFSSPVYANNAGKLTFVDSLGRLLTNHPYDPLKPYLVNNNGGIDSEFVFRSLLSKWKPGNPGYSPSDTESPMRIARRRQLKGINFENFGVDIKQLYQIAYFGIGHEREIGDPKYDAGLFQFPLFEIKDSSVLVFDRLSGKNVFSYCISMPLEKSSEKALQETMQNDLKQYFGYEVKIQNRKLPYWKLIATEKARRMLKSAGAKMSITNPDGIAWGRSSIKNWPMNKFLNLVQYYSSIGMDGAPVVDETGIQTNIDIDVDWAKDFGAVKKALKENGLDLIKSEKLMNVIVISDPKND